VIIGADTIVVLNGRVLGKPSTSGEAKRMLKLLSGKEHKVYTGIAILDSEKKKSFVDYEVTKVRFRVLTKNEIDYYVKSESPMDKGLWNSDDLGSTFVSKL
jgi:septum formation protein